MSIRKIMILVGSIASVLLLIIFSSSILEVNKSGYYQIKQAAITGKMSVRNKPGTYGQFFGEIFTYQISDMNYFSKHDEDGGTGVEAAPIKVRFNDGGTADISGSIKFKLSQIEENQLMLHKDFKSYKAVSQDLVRQVVTESLMQTATLMKAEESYSTRRSEFTTLAESQIREGIFETLSNEIKNIDVEGNEFIERIVDIKYGKDGKPVIRKISPFRRYQIEVLQFVIKDIDFDSTIDNLIAKKKEAEQQKVVARANAERAKQDAITAIEKGKAAVAEAEAEALVIKKRAVVEAQKEREVAEENAKKAIAEARAIKAKGEAEAYSAKLKVQAGLSPLEKAEIEMKTQIGVATELAKVNFPKLLIVGSNGKDGNTLNPFDAVGLKSFIDINKSLSEKE